MRCKSCGGFLKHLITTVTGDRLYRCSTGLTTIRMPTAKNPEPEVGHIVLCENVYELNGELANGHYPFFSGGGTKTLYIEKGLIK